MKSKFLFFAVSILIIVGLAIYGYFRATPVLKNQTIVRPQIEVTPDFFDFGKINFGDVVNYSFRVKNLGQEILEIKRVGTSCACTTAKIDLQKINPGETAKLSVKYDTAAMGEGPHGRGKQERIIYLKTNDPLKPQLAVMIYAEVK